MLRVVSGCLSAGLLLGTGWAHAEPVAPGAAPSGPAASPASPAQSSTPVSSAPPAPKAVRVYMRSGTDPLLFSARAKNDDGTPTLCSAPCDAQLLPGDYQLRLN